MITQIKVSSYYRTVPCATNLIVVLLRFFLLFLSQLIRSPEVMILVSFFLNLLCKKGIHTLFSVNYEHSNYTPTHTDAEQHHDNGALSIVD